MFSLLCKNWKKLSTLVILLFITYLNSSFAGTILVSNVLSNSVTLFDEATLLTVKEIKVGFMPHEVMVSPDGKTALVANFGDLLSAFPGNSLTSIDIANAKITQTIALPNKSRPHGIAFLSDSQALVTAQGIQSLLLINLTNGNIEKTLPLPGAGAHMVITDAAKNFAYIANADSGTISKVNLQTFSVVGEVKVGGQVEGLALTKEEDLLLTTASTSNHVAVVKTNDLSVLKIIKTDLGPVRVFLFNDGKSAVITNTVSGNAQVIDIATLSVINTFKTTNSLSPLPVPINMHIKSDNTAYVTNSLANDITLVDLINGKVLKTFTAAYMPDGIAVSPVNSISTDVVSNTVFKTDPIDINANIETVWQVAKNVEDYNRISHGAITAHVDGQISPGKMIKLALYKDKLVGKFIPESDEIVTVVDDERKILAWIRKLPDGNFTERYQILEKIAENTTRSSIVVRIPGLLGQITKVTYGDLINSSLTELNVGMKVEAEQHVPS